MTAGVEGTGVAGAAPPRRGRRGGWPGGSGGGRRVSPLAGLLAGAAASTFATAVAAGVAGFQANRNLQPIEFTLRVGLLLAAPCIGAMLAILVLPRRAGPRPAWAIGAGVAVGPLLVLRMDRLVEYGPIPAAAGIGALVAWIVAGTAVATSSGTRADSERSSTPAGTPTGPLPDPGQHDADPPGPGLGPGPPGADR